MSPYADPKIHPAKKWKRDFGAHRCGTATHDGYFGGLPRVVDCGARSVWERIDPESDSDEQRYFCAACRAA